jgi:serine/threonine-protein kinase
MYHILYREPCRLESLRSDVPHALAAVVHKALARDAAERFQSAAELGAALAPFADSIRRATELPSDTSMAATAVAEAAIDASHRNPRGRPLAIAAVCALVVGAAALATLWLNQPSVSVRRPATRPEPTGAQAQSARPDAPAPPASSEATGADHAAAESEPASTPPAAATNRRQQRFVRHKALREGSSTPEGSAPVPTTRQSVTVDRTNPY